MVCQTLQKNTNGSVNDKEVSGKIGDERFYTQRFYTQRFLSLPVPTESRVESDVESRVESDVESVI